MKKLIALFILIIGITMLTACSKNEEVFTTKSYNTNISQVTSINIEVRDKKIDITESNDDDIHIQYSESEQEFYEISITNNTLNMTSKTNKNWTDFIGKKPAENHRTITLKIPNGMLDDLTVTTTNENISLTNLKIKNNVSFNSNGGDINIDKLDIDKTLTLKGKNGNINANIIGTYDDFAIITEIKKGEINISNKESGTKKLNVSNNNGDITINFVKNN